MKDKEIGLIIGIIALVLILSGTIDLGNFAIGSSTLSLSQANLQSNNNYLNGDVWVLTFSQGGLGQSYFGTFSPSDVEKATPGQSKTTKTFSLNVNYGDQTWNYPIEQTAYNTPIYNIKSNKWTWVPVLDECTISEAKSRGLSNVLWVTQSSSYNCYAVGYNEQFPVGNIANPVLSQPYTISIITPSGESTKTLNVNSGSTQGAIGSYAYAIWNGNLGSGITHPDQSPYKAVYSDGSWAVTSSSAYTNYLVQYQRTQPGRTSNSIIESQINDLKNAVYDAQYPKSFGSINSRTSLNSAKIQIETLTPVQFPITTLYIKASEIGIYTPTPSFRIVSSNSECFETGEQGTISVILTNDGETGTGTLYAECNSPFSSTYNQQISLSKGETKKILIPISASASSKELGSCRIYIESPGGEKSSTVDTCVEPQITCTPDEIFCSVSGPVEVIKKCSNNGATSSIIEKCGVEEQCQIVFGNPKCASSKSIGDIDGGINGIWETIKDFFSNPIENIKGFFKGIFNFTGDILTIIKNAVVVIIALLSTLYSKEILNRFKSLRKSRAISWIIAIIIGLTLSFVVWKIFWVGLVLFGLFIVAKSVFKLTPVGRAFSILKK